MTVNKAIAGGGIGLVAGATDGLTPLFTYLCTTPGLPIEVCGPLAGWLGPLASAILGALVVWAIPNKS